jgi:hypothetical protein
MRKPLALAVAALSLWGCSGSDSPTHKQAEPPAAMQKVQGDAQVGTVNTALGTQLKVKVVDAKGAGVAGQTVEFAVSGGAGSVSPASGTTGADGTVSTTWTLGKSSTETHTVTAISGSLPSLIFTAAANAGAPVAIIAFAGDGQNGVIGSAASTRPAVKVTDAFGNGVAGVTVSFSVTGGGGTVTGPLAISDANGVATVGGWTLGGAVGANALTATVPGTGLGTVVFHANGLVAVPGSVAALHGSQQAAMVNTAVQTAPAVVVKDVQGNVMAGIQVTFSVGSGGGSVSPATATTDANGVASTAWTLGPVGGPNTLNASVTGTNPASFDAVGCSGGGGAGYAITLCYTSTMTASQRAVFESAAARWGSIVTGDVPNISTSLALGACSGSSPEVNFPIDDLVIFAAIEPIDGVNQILGQAGWCVRRTAGLPLAGIMRFDVADVAGLETGGQFGSVILHEMGHVLGIGSMWSALGLLQDPSGSIAQDTYFSGTNGIAGFNAIGGNTYTAGQKVPVENTGGGGTVNSHWRESVLANELMTGYLNTGENPLSELTVRSLIDLGYTVDATKADPFFITLSVRGSKSGTSSGTLHLVNDVYTGPQYTLDRSGRFTPVR